MKKLNLTNMALAFIAVVGLSFAACKSDPCKDVTCQNDGTCIEGICLCEDGYEGDNCETETRSKFVGTYTASDNCNNSGTATYVVTASNGTLVTEVKIANFWDAFNNAVVATVDGNTITIANQEPDNDGFTVSGQGTLSGSTITWNYTITDTALNMSDVCSSTWTK